MRIVRLLLVGALLACTSCWAYHAGDLGKRHRRWAAVLEVGCIDVATEIVSDPKVDDHDPVVDLRFGNRCDDWVPVDLSKVKVTARWRDGTRAELRAYDPRHEIEPKQLMPEGQGHEAIEFDPVGKHDERPIAVCVDVSSITRADASVGQVCFTRVEDGMLPEGGDA